MAITPMKIVKESAVEQVFSVLKNYITDGTWAVGEKIPSETEIAESFGVSRITVRSAIHKLETLNLVESRVGDGTYVCGFKFSHILDEISDFMVQEVTFEEVSEFRDLLEETSVHMTVARNLSEEDFLPLKECLNNIKKTTQLQDIEKHINAVYRFHLEICRLSGNQMMVYAYMMMNSLATTYWEQQLNEESAKNNGLIANDPWETAYNIHKDIYDSLVHGNEEKAIGILNAIIY